jgi:hypothetical protein
VVHVIDPLTVTIGRRVLRRDSSVACIDIGRGRLNRTGSAMCLRTLDLGRREKQQRKQNRSDHLPFESWLNREQYWLQYAGNEQDGNQRKQSCSGWQARERYEQQGTCRDHSHASEHPEPECDHALVRKQHAGEQPESSHL